jgi:sugar/nucleoside kinase (ribokinase family)
MILAVGEVLMEFRRVETDGAVAVPGTWQGPFCSGAPAIFASVAARLGERLERDGVDTTALTEAPDRSTAVAMVAYDDSGGRDFFFSVRGSAAAAIDAAAAAGAARGASWVHVSGSSIGFGDPLAATVEATVAAALSQGARLSLDPNLRPDSPAEARERTARLARRASVVFPSPGELAALGVTTDELVSGGTLVCATLGAAGVEIHTAGGEPVTRHAPTVTEVDPTGAGDSFAAAFVASLARGEEPVAAAEAACAVAAHSVTVLGAMEAQFEDV